MTWSVALTLLAVSVVAGGAWFLGRPRPVPSLDDEFLADDPTAPRRPGDDAFTAQLRGYRMDQVDAVLDILEARVADRDREIDRLRSGSEPDTVTIDDPEDEPPPRPGPAADTEGDTAAGLPVPLRRSDLLAPTAYLLLAAVLLSGLLVDLRGVYLAQGVQDQQAFEWYFGATAHNLATLANPLFSDLQNFPAGVNLMANAAVMGLGVLLAPVTLLAGPQLTFVLVELLGLSLTASAWFWLFRRHLPVHPLAAAIGAGFAGFAPGLVSHANGHPNFVAQFLVPLIIDRLLRMARRDRPLHDGVVLGLLAAWQLFIGEEVLLLTAVGLAVAGAVLVAHGVVDLRRLLTGVGVAAGVCLAVVAVPLWWQFSGPQSYASIWHPPAGNDLAQLWGRATRSLGADPWASAAVSMNRTEENSFFGIPLLVAAAAVVVLRWRRPLVQALGAVVVVACWLSLGEEVVVHGRTTGIPGPWSLLELVPVIQNVLPTRFALVAVPALAALLALGIDAVRAGATRYAGHAGAGLVVASAAAALVLLPVVPTPLVVEPRTPVPAFFGDGTWREWVDEGGSVLAVPPPNVADTQALEWQAAARWAFPVVAGYFVGPDSSPERVGQYGATPTALTSWLWEISESEVERHASDAEVEQFRADLRAGRVDAVVLPDSRAGAGALRESISDAFGAPDHVGGVYVWDVRDVTDGAG